MIDFFSPDYSAARSRFRSAVLRNNGQIESILLNATGPAGEDLTLDIGWFGSQEPARVLVHSSGLHGVEGFAGSAIQLQWLEQGVPKISGDRAIAIVHAMNPFGMAWLRRANENNVDLNCNFLASDEEYAGSPDRYGELDSFLNPQSPPARDWFPLRAAWNAARHGMPTMRSVLHHGQYEFPQGLAWGGRQREQAVRRFQLYISGKLAYAERVVAVDVHTGPGCFGEETRPESGKGSLEGLYLRMFPGAKVHFHMQEFGSCTTLRALEALRAENRQHHFGAAGASNSAKADLLEVFCPSNVKWRESVLSRGAQTLSEAAALAFDSINSSNQLL